MATGQAERLIPMLEGLLAEAGLGWRDLGRLGVGVGPGNFTGVRIAVAAARGLALGLGIPAIGVGRMEALAHGLPRPVVVVEDARRGEVWVQRFDADGAGDLLLRDPAEVATDFAGLPVTGSAARAGADTAGPGVTGGAVLAPAAPLAAAIAQIAAHRLPGARPAPIYLRPADAAPARDAPPVILP